MPSSSPTTLLEEFEKAWRSGRRPLIESYLERVEPPQRETFFRELLAVEVECRLRRGERPAMPDYRARFASRDEMIKKVFFKPAPVLPSAGSRTGALGDDEVGLTLTVTGGPNAGKTYAFAGHEVFLAGRSRHAHLRLNDDYFSRVHFLVEINPPFCRLTDMDSRNGTFVNGEKVKAADLTNGSVIRAGHTTLEVSIVGPGAAGQDEIPRVVPETLDGVAALPPEAVPVTLADATPEPAADATPPPAVTPVAPTQSARLRVGPYRLVRELGKGGMGVVYLAEREPGGEQVALKTIVPAVAVARSHVDRFLRESLILCQLDHPHIVPFRDVGDDGEWLYFAMEYVVGQDAGQIVRGQGPLPVRTAVRIMCQVLSALEYAHGKGFVHRDIKPGNILVGEADGKRVVKVVDFGLARVYQESRLSGLTLQDDIGGTLGFMPPEQITQFRQVQPPADQYGAAATLYYLLTGRLLFNFNPRSPTALMAVLQEEPVPLLDRRPELPPGLAAAVHRALAKDPGARYLDARAFRAALLPFAQ